jgi:hypothetical protein
LLYGLEEKAMKKSACVFAAFAVLAPALASAEELGVRVGGDRDMYRDRDFRAARAEFAYGEHDRGVDRARYRGAHRGHDRAVIVKRQHR